VGTLHRKPLCLSGALKLTCTRTKHTMNFKVAYYR
jgi:hypothetical protein